MLLTCSTCFHPLLYFSMHYTYCYEPTYQDKFLANKPDSDSNLLHFCTTCSIKTDENCLVAQFKFLIEPAINCSKVVVVKSKKTQQQQKNPAAKHHQKANFGLLYILHTSQTKAEGSLATSV